jgi:hypothetical protein
MLGASVSTFGAADAPLPEPPPLEQADNGAATAAVANRDRLENFMVSPFLLVSVADTT